MSYVFLIEQMTMTIRLLATGRFVHAQVKVEHPVCDRFQIKLLTFCQISDLA